MAHHTSFTLDDCLSECDLSAPGARELKDIHVIVLIPDAYGVGSDVVQVDKIFPIAKGVIDKARGNTAFRTKLGSVLTSHLNFEARMSYQGIVCPCSQPVKDLVTRTLYSISPDSFKIFGFSFSFCDIPEHFTKAMQKSNSPLITEMMELYTNQNVKNRVFNFCAMCEQGAKERKMQFCSRCKVCPYCSKDCQKAHWKKHKKVCTPSLR
jgi:hypothetical protein